MRPLRLSFVVIIGVLPSLVVTSQQLEVARTCRLTPARPPGRGRERAEKTTPSTGFRKGKDLRVQGGEGQFGETVPGSERFWFHLS